MNTQQSNAPDSTSPTGQPSASLSTLVHVGFNSEIGLSSEMQMLYTALSEHRKGLIKYLLRSHQEARADDGNYEEAANVWHEINQADGMLHDMASRGFEQASKNYWAFSQLESAENYQLTREAHARREKEILADYLHTFDLAIQK